MPAREPYQYEQIENLVSNYAHFEYFDAAPSYVPFHWHDAVEVISILDGELIVTFRQNELTIRTGDIITINPNVLHSTLSKFGGRAIVLQIPSSVIYRFLPEMRENTFVWDPFTLNSEKKTAMEEIKDLLNRMLSISNSTPPGYILRFESLLLELIYQLYINFAANVDQQCSPKNKNIERLTTVMEYTSEHYKDPVVLQDIANVLHLQVNYFCRFFRENTGTTYLNYVNEYRLSKIYHDLLTTDTPLRDILETHGFTNYKLFRHMFYNHFGLTPSSIRKQMRG